MSGLGLVGALFVLFLMVCWVAWRYFVSPAQLAGSGEVELDVVVTPIADSSPAEPLPFWAGVGGFKGLAKIATCWGGLRRFGHWSVLAAIPLGGMVVVLVLALSSNISTDPLRADEMFREQHIKFALNPEHLVPPPDLPPSMFVSAEMPALASADRDWVHMDAEFVQLVLQLFSRVQQRGYTLVLLEGYRSPERQESLAAMSSHVTNARAFESKHQFGLAVDLAPMRDGVLVISERDPWAMQAYDVLGEEAEKMGLVWGGRWSFKDYGHVEAPGSIQANLNPPRS